MKEGVDIDPIGKTLPLKATKLPMTRAADIQHADVKEISHLDPSYTYKNVDQLSQSSHIHAASARDVHELNAMDSSMRVQQYREAKESFMTMMEIRNVLVEAYEEVKKMQHQI